MNDYYRMQKYMREHLTLYIYVSVLIVMGILFGALLVNALSLEQKQDLNGFLSSFLHTVYQGLDNGNYSSFQEVFAMHMKWLALIGFLGMTVIGIPLVLILDFLKGVLIGFTVGYMVGEFSFSGLLLALVTVAPQNAIMLPVMIIGSVTAISYSIYILKNRVLHHRGSLKSVTRTYMFTMSILLLAVVVVSLFEVYVTPAMIQWVIPYVL